MEQNSTAKIRMLLAMVLFGTIGLFVRYIPLPSAVISLVRSITGTLFLLIYCRIRKISLSTAAIRRNLPRLMVSGAALGINWILLFEAYRYTTVAIATACYYLAPVFVILLSPLLFSEALSKKKAICSALAILGMVFVSGILTPHGGSGNLTGVLYGLSAAVFYATVVLLNKGLKGISPYEQTVFQLGFSAIILLPYVLLTEPLGTLTLTPLGGILLLVVGILHTGVAYTLYFSAVPAIPGQTAAILSYLDPVIAVLLSAIVLREGMEFTVGLGVVLVLLSTLASEWSPKKANTR